MQWAIVIAAFLASAVEFVEAFTLVLVARITTNWRSAIVGALGAVATLTVIVATLGVALVTLGREVMRPENKQDLLLLQRTREEEGGTGYRYQRGGRAPGERNRGL